MKKIFYSSLLCLAVLSGAATVTSCSDDGPDTNALAKSFDVDFTVPASMVAEKGQYLTFAVNEGKAPVDGDLILLENGSGILTECTVTGVTENAFSIAVPDALESGNYHVIIKRGDRRKTVGFTAITVVERSIDPQNATIYGVVADAAGNGIEGVQVTDGDEVVLTDQDGVYRIKSTKRLGYVYYTVPAGYEPATDGVMPQIHKYTRLTDAVPERIDFALKSVGSQDNYKVIFLGDMHLANRNSDITQFKAVMNDFNKYRGAQGSGKIYAVTLGDMSWDLYWYDNKFNLNNYVSTINECVSDVIMYHVIGNHDNDYKTTSNVGAKQAFRSIVAPNYYSFNIGNIHYVVLDDIDCSTYDGTTSRKYAEKLVAEQLEWLRKDLANVDKATPVFIAMHAPVFYPSGATNFKKDLENTDELLNIVNGYTVHFVTGHTHKNYNVQPSHSVTGGKDIYEHNVPAVCSDWWYSGSLTPGCLVAPDGAPSGYMVWDVKGKELSNIYKTFGRDENYQFRAYDLNNVSFSLDDVPNLKNATVRATFQSIVADYTGDKKNEVLINVWNYNPKWTVSVTTKDGAALTATAVQAYDPLHIAAQTVKRFNKDVSSAPNFPTVKFCHFFKVTAPDADTDLVITVKDEFGHTWTEEMQRPKAFSTEAYKVNL